MLLPQWIPSRCEPPCLRERDRDRDRDRDKRQLQNARLSLKPVLIILGVSTLLALYLWHSLSAVDFDDGDLSLMKDVFKKFYYPQRFPELFPAGSAAEPVRVYDNTQSFILRAEQRERMPVYLTALHQSVSLVELPFTSTLHKALRDCAAHEQQTRSLAQGALSLSLELRFPALLHAMRRAAQQQQQYQEHTNHTAQQQARLSLWLRSAHPQTLSISLEADRHYHTHSALSPPSSQQQQQASSSLLNGASVSEEHQHVFDAPLFFFVNSFPVTVAQCTRAPSSLSSDNARDHPQRDWKSTAHYLHEISTMVVHTNEWKESDGLDFFSTAGHAKAAPVFTSSSSASSALSIFAKQSFLRTDFDLVGGAQKKDVLVSSALPAPHAKIGSEIDWQTQREKETEGERSSLLVFVDTEITPSSSSSLSPRQQWHLAMHKLQNVQDVLFVANPKLRIEEQRTILRNSEFCLFLRSGVSSSVMLWEILAADCIPVIIADWLALPFESLLDYSRFSLRFFDNTVHQLPSLLSRLRSIDESTRQEMKRGVREARRMLLFEESSEGQISVLNPVTLSLVEMLQRREKYCASQSLLDVNSPALCLKILNRIQTAEHLLENDKI